MCGKALPARSGGKVSRRRFLKDSSLAGAAAAASIRFISGSSPEPEFRVGVIGCGGRGTGAALNILQAETEVIYPPPRNGWHTENAVPGASVRAQNVRVVALADVFEDRLESCREQLRKVGNDVEKSRCFAGFRAFEELLALQDINYVILASPPHFRPRELRAAVEAGKNVFMEKPIAVDSPGVRSVLESGEIARKKGLAVGAGTQRRHEADFVETVSRLQGGAIGRIVEARSYFNIGEIWMIPREPGWTDMEWHLRNWNYFTWLSGDIIVEQHIHNLDVINWILQSHPIQARGMGGRQARPSNEYGHIYDHFAVEYEYPDGVRMFSQNCQIKGWSTRVGCEVLGTKGNSNCQDTIRSDSGGEWRFENEFRNAYEQEHIDLMESIRSGRPINEAASVAESTLTAIMGREAAYSGQVITWEAAYNSRRDYTPDAYEFGEVPLAEVVVPSRYKFI